MLLVSYPANRVARMLAGVVSLSGGFFVRSLLFPAACMLVALFPVAAPAAVVDPSLVPDGTYVVKVEKVQDGQHLLVMMDNGVETTLVATGSAQFGKIRPNDTLKVSLIKGKVPVFSLQ